MVEPRERQRARVEPRDPGPRPAQPALRPRQRCHLHLWTLATEEQFYLLWPAVLTIGFATRRTGPALALSAAACLLACTVTVLWLREAPDLAYTLPTSWAGCFVIGAGARSYGDRGLVLGILCLLPLRGHALTYVVAGPLIAVLTGVVLLAWRDWTEVGHPALRPLVWLGSVSCAAYLWNHPLTVWLRPHLGVAAGVTAAAATLVLAAVSWRLVEQPTRSTPKVLVA